MLRRRTTAVRGKDTWWPWWSTRQRWCFATTTGTAKVAMGTGPTSLVPLPRQTSTTAATSSAIRELPTAVRTRSSARLWWSCMATSSSNEPTRVETWRARASVYSGRPDPEWDLDQELVKRLLEMWEQMEPSHSAPPHPPGLGYRGAVLESSEGKWFSAYNGAVQLTAGKSVLVREDSGRDFERLILQSAPPSTLPPFVRGSP